MNLLARTVLTLALAAPALAQTPATQPSPVKREAARVWIDGTKPLKWESSPPHTFPGALAAATASGAHPLDYDAMLSASGVAYRLRWYRGLEEDKWHGAAPIVELKEEVDAIEQACGYRFEFKFGDRPGDHAKAIMKSIDDGLCVLSYVNRKEWDVGYIYGYEQGGKRWRVADYYRGMVTVPADDPHAWFMFLTWTGNVPPEAESTIRGMQIGVSNWNRGELPAEKILPWGKAGEAKLCYGDTAYTQWISDIKSAGEYLPKQAANLRHVSAWVAWNLRDARASAARTLRRNAKSLGGKSEAKAIAAAEICERMAKRFEDEQAGKKVFTFGHEGAWTDEMREKELAILADLQKLDQQMINLLEQTLGGDAGEAQ